ncbi:hypothetical protein ANCCEY_11322 [Ancylostoma ceylanicum]|uniref:Uncharacterized protein n=1 Tax=Ancylostoma ceylanicum TaxID=53326 RepID=A0A0D6LEF2_9BILA|nr:hypothetical protein ANCCEY_11322 [Ancylostoma ceylanicum]
MTILLVPRHDPQTYVSYILDDPEFGKMAYTISILLMFSLVILLLMIRSIRRSSSTIQMEALLDAMRFREELDLQERQRRRLMKAKTKVCVVSVPAIISLVKNANFDHYEKEDKHGAYALEVTAWLSRTHGGEFRGWRSSPALIQQRRTTSSTISEIPRVVVTVAAEGRDERPITPCLSLLYDFAEEQKEHSTSSSRCSMSFDMEQTRPLLGLQSHSLSMES